MSSNPDRKQRKNTFKFAILTFSHASPSAAFAFSSYSFLYFFFQTRDPAAFITHNPTNTAVISRSGARSAQLSETAGTDRASLITSGLKRTIRPYQQIRALVVEAQ